MKRKETGNLGEKLARDFLIQKGYRILESNYRCSFGEIDIIASQGNCLVFVEVRTRSSLSFGTPEESITSRKKLHFVRTAEHYLQNHKIRNSSWRIDMVAVELDAGKKIKRIEIIENALEE
jgi:putative endonuclease